MNTKNLEKLNNQITTTRQKAKQIKREAINAILEAKNIKNTYMIDSDSDSDVDSDFDEESETIDLDLDI